jgi:hypothetical protein
MLLCSILQLIQYCKHKGIRTINVVRRQEQVQELKDLGCVIHDRVPTLWIFVLLCQPASVHDRDGATWRARC